MPGWGFDTPSQEIKGGGVLLGALPLAQSAGDTDKLEQHGGKEREK